MAVVLSKISIIGSGFVGTSIGKGFKKIGNEVIFYDIDETRVDQLKQEGYDATTDISYAINNSDISFVAVPTPTVDGKIDLSFIRSAVGSVGKSLKGKNNYHVIVIKSTVLPTTTENIVKPIVEQTSGKKCGQDFGLCMNPEFLTEIHHTWTDDKSALRDFFAEEKIVIGQFDKKSGDVVEELFKPLNIPILKTDLKTAETIKYASNCCLASRISYWNEIFYICNKFGVDSDIVAKIVGMDKRIGKYGTIHGKAFGGKCLPKDLQAFISFAQGLGYKPIFLDATNEINERIKKDKGVRE